MERYPQDKSCSEFINSLRKGPRSAAVRDVPICASCRSPGPESREDNNDEEKEECLFQGFRVLLYHRRPKSRWSYEFKAYSQRSPMNLRAVYSRKLKPADIDLKKSIAKTYLLPFLKRESLAWESGQPEPTYRQMDVSTQTECDRCRSCIFSESWFCTDCGREFCGACFDPATSPCDHESSFLRLTRFLQDELKLLESEMESIPDWKTTKATLGDSKNVRLKRKNQMPEEKFREYWVSRRPFVIGELNGELQVQWTPEYFIDNFGTESCDLEDCQTRETLNATVAQFFAQFGRSRDENSRVVKLKDWPPAANFKDKFPQLFKDFEHAIPLPQYTTSEGAMNLAAHFPLNSIAPDLGPKMYNALASSFDDGHSGTTRLHLDLSDAVNLMPYATNTEDGRPGSARWHIFKVEDKSKIREYLKTKHGDRPGDPIHNQDYYLTPSMLTELKEQYGVCPWEVIQKVGHAVFIPAGCAHQVLNETDCMKVACDFIAPESIPICKELWEEFRTQRLACAWPRDVIPFFHMLYYTWLSATNIASRDIPYVPTEHSSSTDSDSYYCPFCLPRGEQVFEPKVSARGRKFKYPMSVVQHVASSHLEIHWDTLTTRRLTQGKTRPTPEILARRMLQEQKLL